MRLGWNAGLQRHVDRRQHGLFVVLKDSARISTISRSPPGFFSRYCCKARNASGSSANGAPLRSAPGLRCTTAR
jgi:hypothetical protein